MPADLLSHRLIFVTGKGGVGKTTVARALGLLAAGRGRRVIVAELGVPGGDGGIDEVQMAPGLFSIAIDPQAAMEEYLRVKAGSFGGALSHSKVFGTLAMATPGLREMLAMGKIWELAQLERRTREADAYDLVVVDAPATGHGVAALRTPRVFADTARVGPIANRASIIAATIADRSFTAIVAVTVAEEMPVRETLSLAETLGEDGLELDLVVLNERYADRFSPAEVERIRRLAGVLADDPARSALLAALSIQARTAAQQPHLSELRAAFGDRLCSLPFLFSQELDPAQLTTLADLLDRELR